MRASAVLRLLASLTPALAVAVLVLGLPAAASALTGEGPRAGLGSLLFPDPAPDPAPSPAPEPEPAPSAGPTPAGDADPASPVAQPCFGAAALDPEQPCENPGLSLTVFPEPAKARALQGDRRCDFREKSAGGLLDVCFWGTPAARATRTIALIGDSHAAHWRPAMDAVVARHRWRAVSIQRAGCPLTLAHPNLPGRARQTGCKNWNRAVQRWMAAHPEIDVVFTSQHRGTVIPPAGQTPGTARINGYMDAWRSLLRRHVRQIVVIRGTPRISTTTIPCVEQAVADGVPPGQVCALSSRYALRPDPAAEAAKMLAAPQVQVADLATFFCRRRLCSPVTGGALVLRDVSHMTTTYSRTLGPYLLRRVDALMTSWPRPADAAPAPSAAVPAAGQADGPAAGPRRQG